MVKILWLLSSYFCMNRTNPEQQWGFLLFVKKDYLEKPLLNCGTLVYFEVPIGYFCMCACAHCRLKVVKYSQALQVAGNIVVCGLPVDRLVDVTSSDQILVGWTVGEKRYDPGDNTSFSHL